MNKTEMIEKVAQKAGLTKKDAQNAINAYNEAVVEALVAGEKVQMVGFGTFEVKERAARQGRNPQTKEIVEIPATKAPVFKFGKPVKDAVNG